MRASRVCLVILLMAALGMCAAGAVFAQSPPAAAPPVGAAPPGAPPAPAPPAKIDTGDTAWVLMSSALVLLMTAPGLATAAWSGRRTRSEP